MSEELSRFAPMALVLLLATGLYWRARGWAKEERRLREEEKRR